MNETATGDLAGRVAIVTGGGRGIGAAIVHGLHARGAAVVVADSGTSIGGDGADPGVATGLVDRLGARAAAFTESIASPSAAKALVDAAVDRFGCLDIVVSNAAILRDAFVFRADPYDWDAVIANNLSAAFYLLAAATPVLRDNGKAGRGGAGGYDWGRIVTVVSTAGLYGNYGQSAYAAAKAGLVGLTRVAALDMARARVTANAVAPFAHTRVTDTIKPANDAQAAYKERALKVGAEHVGNLVGWLAGSDAGDVSGQVFGVRGREVFLFSQPRPKRRAVLADAGWGAVRRELEAGFVPLETDLEAFNTEPVV
ncbi:MAG: SDR family NAD(P)-dependent oxidoreductase [Alphaproteobacteria bacterium]|nr:SDR family NAD(P)-dependent oxidoreductase [Alphaproteobacteria bacterium]